jgi:hypothetical protein
VSEQLRKALTQLAGSVGLGCLFAVGPWLILLIVGTVEGLLGGDTSCAGEASLTCTLGWIAALGSVVTVPFGAFVAIYGVVAFLITLYKLRK